MYFGGYPGAAEFIGDHDRWRGYILRALIEPNIERDILAMQRVDKPALLKRLFEISAESSGQILSYTKMLGQLQDAGNTTTLARYLDLLGKVGLVAGLQNYSGAITRRRASNPKLNVLNTALMSAQSSYDFEDAQADRTFWGRLVESAAGAHLWNTATGRTHLWYWRHSPDEVDFVMERGPRLVGFEVKSHERQARPPRARRVPQAIPSSADRARRRRRRAFGGISFNSGKRVAQEVMDNPVKYVERTCTEVSDNLGGADQTEDPTESKPLSHYGDQGAYVLLGAPGAGKTEEFKRKAGERGFCDARDFTTYGHERWSNVGPLFIDGLDEMRAGETDGRTPLDAIRQKLDQLGRPRFRLSCREADWFGAADRKRLESVSPDGVVKVLRLDPLTDEDIRTILDADPQVDDADEFVAKARDRGLHSLLDNPKSLEMLVRGVSAQRDGAWPDTRTETFDLACRALVREHNDERNLAEPNRPDVSGLLDMAGRLCAVQLLTGRAGYHRTGNPPAADYIALDDLGNVSTGNSSRRT